MSMARLVVTAGARSVVCRYNHSSEYGKLVLSIAASNSCGDDNIVPTRHRVRRAAHSTMAVIYEPVPQRVRGQGSPINPDTAPGRTGLCPRRSSSMATR
jgi:hypothetical protein